jgi:hypothetical protein
MASSSVPKRDALTRVDKTLHTADNLEAGPRPPREERRAGTIEQQLDMNERGPLKGDDVLREPNQARLHEPAEADSLRTEIPDDETTLPPLDPDKMVHNYNVDMSEEGREGDEESGDEHSAGLQGSDQQELQYDDREVDHADSGVPGEMTGKVTRLDPSRRGYRHRAG